MSSQQGPDFVPNPKWSRRHTHCSLPRTISSHLHQKVQNEICADSVQYRHIQSDLLSKCSPAVEHPPSRHLPAISWQLQDPSQQFPFRLSTGLRSVFTARCYESVVLAMALCPSVRPSQVGVLLKRLNVGSHKQHVTIAQGL